MIASTESNSTNTLAKPGKYLTFLLGHEFYALPVLNVREIIRVGEITPVPQMPAFVKGVINLRGKLVPVTDLRVRFDLAHHEFNESTCIVVAQVKTGAGGLIHMGFIVDGVEEVLNLAEGDIEKTPDFGTKVDAEYLRGMANVKGKVIALLDIDRVLDRGSIERVAEAAAPVK